MKRKLERIRKKKMERMECLKNENERYGESERATAKTRGRELGFSFSLFPD